jgi:hypothetical protein
VCHPHLQCPCIGRHLLGVDDECLEREHGHPPLPVGVHLPADGAGHPGGGVDLEHLDVVHEDGQPARGGGNAEVGALAQLEPAGPGGGFIKLQPAREVLGRVTERNALTLRRRVEVAEFVELRQVRAARSSEIS